MKQTYQIIYLLFTWIVLGSCMKDEGNYDYREVNKIVISGMEKEYFLTYDRPVLIKPELVFTADQQGDTGRYKYEWILDGLSGYSMPYDTISRSRNLDMVLKPKRGCADYKAYFKVTDTVTGISSKHTFLLHVTTSAYEGWLLLCDMENGTSRLDMVSQQGEKDTLYRDILKSIGSTFPMQGAPAFVVCGPIAAPPMNNLTSTMIATDKKASLLGMDTLEYKSSYDFNSFATGDKITDFTGARLFNNLSGSLLYAQGNIYEFTNQLSRPQNYITNASLLFKAAPFIAQTNGYDGKLVFDQDAHTILLLTSQGCRKISAGERFDYAIDNNAPGGMELVYMEGTTYNNGEAFIVMKARQTGRYYLGRCSFNGSEQSYYAEITGMDIGQAEHFAVNPEFGYLFYNVGGKIYEYDPVQQKSFLMKDYGSKKITQLKFQQLNFSDLYRWSRPPDRYEKYASLRRKLLVASYTTGNPQTSGVLDIYDVPSVNQPVKLYKSYSGTGKIASIGFRER